MHLIVFRNRKRAGIDQAAYDADAAAMEELARRQPGYRSFKSYAAADGEVVSLSEWDSAEAAKAWGRVAEHRSVQARGRDAYYAAYTLFACDRPRIRHFEQEGP